MNREAIQKWIEALRSGAYEQIKDNYMDSGYKACAVGVAIIELNNESDSENRLLSILGISMPVLEKVIYMNDQESKTFPEIADYLEGLMDADSAESEDQQADSIGNVSHGS